ncbi:MAG: CAP domain-containing protein [Boseongicola sp.]
MTGIDQALLDNAIRLEVNYHRCRAGLGPLTYAGRNLATMATKHSAWMAKTKKLSHFNTMPGLKSLGERVRASGTSYRGASENIVKVHRYQFNSSRFKTIDRRRCQFARKGKLIPAHSYASLARHSVDLWMDSAPHRRNILSNKMNRMVVGVAFANSRKYCGEYWLTQDFIG